MVSNKVVKPLKKDYYYGDFDIAEGEGDLTRRLERIETRDEFEKLSKKFNKFVDKIHDTVVKVRENSSKRILLSRSALHKDRRNENIIAQQSNHAVEVATAVEEMSEKYSSRLQKMQSIQGMKPAGHLISRKTGEGKQLENIEIMDRLKERWNHLSNAVDELGKLSDLIDQIIKAIEEIADQTTLL